MQNELLPPHDGPETPLAEPETAKQKFERERLTRRQALKKFGMTSAMATFALFSVDDLARMVAGAMESQARNSKIAEQVAQEFQHSGIAIGAVQPVPYYSPCNVIGCVDPCVAPKYYRCDPCLFPCSGSKIVIDVCSKYTVGTNKNDCYTCCSVTNSLNNLLQVAAYYACRALC